MATVTANLRDLLASSEEILVAPGASDALSARLIEAHGYKCVYIGSYATAASRLALPDTGTFVVGIASRAGARPSRTPCASP